MYLRWLCKIHCTICDYLRNLFVYSAAKSLLKHGKLIRKEATEEVLLARRVGEAKKSNRLLSTDTTLIDSKLETVFMLFVDKQNNKMVICNGHWIVIEKLFNNYICLCKRLKTSAASAFTMGDDPGRPHLGAFALPAVWNDRWINSSDTDRSISRRRTSDKMCINFEFSDWKNHSSARNLAITIDLLVDLLRISPHWTKTWVKTFGAD